MGEFGEGIPIDGGDDESMKNDVWMQRDGRRKWASPIAPSMSPCCIVEGEEEAREIEADVEIEVRGQRAVGNTISISDRAKEKIQQLLV